MMTADHLTDALIALRNKYKRDIDDARERSNKVHSLCEQIVALGGNTHLEGYGARTLAEYRPDLEQPIRRKFYEDAHNLLADFMGFQR